MPAAEAHALRHGGETEPARALFRPETAAIIADLHAQLRADAVQLDANLGGATVPNRVVHALLKDAEQVFLDLVRQIALVRVVHENLHAGELAHALAVAFERAAQAHLAQLDRPQAMD